MTQKSGLTLLHKVKWEHIYLTSYSKMRVDLAAQVCLKYHTWRTKIIFFLNCFVQVLSGSVAKALVIQNNPETFETQRFVSMFNKFFDLLNVRSLNEAARQRNPDKEPYRYPEDDRLKVMLN